MRRYAARRRLTLPGTLALMTALFSTPRSAHAQQVDRGAGAAPGAPRAAPAAELARSGAFVAWTESARTDSHFALARAHGGYRGGVGAFAYGAAEVVLVAPARGGLPRSGRNIGVALRGAALAPQPDELRGELGIKAQLLYENDAGADLTLAVSYQDHGFNLRPEIVSMVLAGTRLGPVSLLANVAYGNGLSDDERYGMVRVAALAPLTERIQIGVDSTASFDLELDADEPLGEPERDIQVAPTATLCLDAAVLSAQAGVSVLELRFEEPRVGSVVLLGAGGAF
jgi:hypothetical protein